MIARALFLFIIIGKSTPAFSQIHITGWITDANHRALANVNIGIKNKNTGTVSRADGSFTISIPEELLSTTLTFSLVGYHELDVPVRELALDGNHTIRLHEKITQLDEVVINGEKLVEKKYGIKKRGIIHFTDGIFKKDDSFEIGQVINLGNTPVQITSLNLHLNSSRPDSASFRVNFYNYDEDENLPQNRIIEKSILQRHPIREGWLNFNLSEYNIMLKGKVFAALEFIPENLKDVKQILYEVKIGGTSKSFFRRNSLGQWVTPPHHYCLYVTALTDKRTPDEPDDLETPPTTILNSDFSKEPFSLFVRLPKDYTKDVKKNYPVIYHLDGNAFFDPVANSVDRFTKKKKIPVDPIVVGIGYKNAYVMDSLRDRDYTFPAALPADSFRISGRGEQFYHFIKTMVIPHIDSTYRTDKNNRTIMGHSLGGYFVLYALLCHTANPSMFSNYIAASPSLNYHNRYLIKHFENLYDQGNSHKKVKLYLTIGELEIMGSESTGFGDLSQILTTQNFIHIRPKVYKNLEHMGTAMPSFEEGIQFILSDH
jgi:predicted alpha/beta superfamily hydrolase